MVHTETFVNMETDGGSVSNFIEKSANNLTNNNTIQLNCDSVVTDDCIDSANGSIQKDKESSDSDTQNNIDTEKPNFFELIDGNKNCDSESSDCNNQTILNNNDLPISYVDDDEETNGDQIQSNSDETTKGHENNIG